MSVPLLVLGVGRDAEGPAQGRRLGRYSTVFASAGECPGTVEAGLGLVTRGSWAEATCMCSALCHGIVAIGVCACTALPQAAVSVWGTY